MRVLITGVSGMDGSHLAEILAEREGWELFGMIRDPDVAPRNPIHPAVQQRIGDLGDYDSVARVVRDVRPDIIYHLGALSSPEQAWRMPGLCADITGAGTRRVLEAAAHARPNPLVVVAASIATHGPYGAAKTYAAAMCDDYRQRGYPVTTVAMGGHHSPRRGGSYLSQKVARHAAAVATLVDEGSEFATIQKLHLGWLGRRQDWGWAPDFMHVWANIHEVDPGAYRLSTNWPISVSAYVAECYNQVGLLADLWTIQESAPGGELGQPTDVPVLSTLTSVKLQPLTKGLVSFEDPLLAFSTVIVPGMVGAGYQGRLRGAS